MVGLIAADRAGLAIDNRARAGATWAVVRAAGRAADPWLIPSGGNDVMRLHELGGPLNPRARGPAKGLPQRGRRRWVIMGHV